jgi:class 3 adenylate cyclase
MDRDAQSDQEKDRPGQVEEGLVLLFRQFVLRLRRAAGFVDDRIAQDRNLRRIESSDR